MHTRSTISVRTCFQGKCPNCGMFVSTFDRFYICCPVCGPMAANFNLLD